MAQPLVPCCLYHSLSFASMASQTVLPKEETHLDKASTVVGGNKLTGLRYLGLLLESEPILGLELIVWV